MSEQLDIFETSEKTEQESQSGLTPRQWALWRLIKHNSLEEHRKTTQKEICEKLKDYGYKWVETSGENHDHCSTIWKDVKDNNESLEHDKIIISKNFEYWIGSERETKEFIKNLWKALSPRLKRYWNYLNKLGLNNQGKLFSNQGNPIDDNSLAKQFHECFNQYDIEMQKQLGEITDD